MWPATLHEAITLIQSGGLSPFELTEIALRRIDEVDGAVQAFELVAPERALETAARAERDIAAGRPVGPLHGIPVGIKDVFDTAGIATTGSSAVLAGRVPDRDAAAVSGLRAAGAVVLGKTRTVEFGVGVEDTPTRNPWNLARLPGGSSGGSAAAVAADECLLALGSDTGGSIRIPAGLCGVTGLRPTFGRISCRGMLPASWSLDQPGPMARTALDVAIAMSALDNGPTTTRDRPEDFTAGIDHGVRGLTLGVATNLLPRVDQDVADAFDTALSDLRAAGARLKDVRLPMLDYVQPTYLPLALAEAGQAHERLLRDRGALYSDPVRTVLTAGQLVRGADYVRAQRARAAHNHAWRCLFTEERIDAVVAPGLPTTAPAVASAGHVWPDGTVQSLAELAAPACLPSTVTGLPTLSVPCGFDGGDMPVSMQLIGRPMDESLLLRIAHRYQRTTEWTTSRALNRIA